MRIHGRAIIVPIVIVLAVAGLAADLHFSLVEAAKKQDWNTVRALLVQKTNVNSPQEDGVTALHWAAHWNELGIVDSLIRAGANPNAANELGVTALSLACVNGNAAMIERLLEAGANPNIASSNGESPLITCAGGGNVDSVKLLLSRGANVNARENVRGQTALMWAVAERHSEIARVLLDHGADIHARSRVTHQLVVRDIEGARSVCPPDVTEEARTKTSYKVQTIAGRREKPKAACARADMAAKGGSTPLLFAARNGDLESAKILVSAGANVNDTAPDESSALVVAAYSGQGSMAAFLLAKGANPNDAGAGYTALHAAILRGDLALVKALLAHGANPNAQFVKGTPVQRDNTDLHLRSSLAGATPLFLAAKYVEVDIMRALRAAGANPSLGLKDGTTPLMAASGVGFKTPKYTRRETVTPGSSGEAPDDASAMEAVNLLLDMGTDVNVANEDGDTALHGAASVGYNAIFQLLVDKGAKRDATNNSGQTPADMTKAKKGIIP